ncbi:EPM2A-interacting protein 1 [Bienertia sinuspersici]
MEKLRSNLLMPHNQPCIWLFQRGEGQQTRTFSWVGGGGIGCRLVAVRGGGWGNGSLKRRVIEGGNGAPIPSRTS